jgi:hypothetical protein
VSRTIGNRILPEFSRTFFLLLSLVLVITGCNSYSPPSADTMPPTAPGALKVTAPSPTQINLSWAASTDNIAVTGYKVERCQLAACSNFTQIAVTTTTIFSNTGLTASTSYSYRVRATDAAGNLSTYSSPGTVSTPAPPIQVTLSSTAASVQAGIGTQTFTATVQNDLQSKGVTWTLTQSGTNCSPTCGTVLPTSSASGAPVTYTAPSNQPSSSGVTLTATSVSDISKFQVAAITVTPAVSVSVSPTPISVQFNAIQFFTATVLNDVPNKGVNWALSGTGCSGIACGTLSAISSPSGVPIKYTGPSGVPHTNPTVTLTATSITDTNRSNPATITVTPNPGTTAVSISPKRAAITTGQTQSFVATVTGASDMTVQWAVDGIAGGNSASLGTIDGNGNYTPPTTGTIGASHAITALSNADVTKNATAPISVTDLVGVYTYHNDNSRTGANLKEYALTTSSVATASFGKLFSCPMDASIYAQPLWAANQSISGGTHNVIYLATEHNTVFALDADGPTCQNLWGGPKNLIPTGETWVSSNDPGCSDLVPDIGITGTPVIDPSTSTMYLVTKTKTVGGSSTTYHQRLHALSILDGSEKFGGPMEIQASVSGTGGGTMGGTLNFDPLINAQRPALLLESDAGGEHVVISWASHCDNGQYHGWVISYNAGTLAREAIFNSSPDGTLAGIWMSGNGPAADSTGNIYFVTGNGTFDVNTSGTSYGDSIVKLGPPAGGKFPVLSYFSPSNQANLEAADTDLGSGGLLLLPDLTTGTHKQVLVQAGKDTRIFLVDRNSMGGFNGSSNNVVQQVSSQLSGGMWGSPAYWNGFVYFGEQSDNLKSFSFNAANSGVLSTSPTSQSNVGFGFPGTNPSVSASATTNGVVWAQDVSQYCTPQSSGCGPTILHAFDATKLSTELWNSSQVSADSAGFALKFTAPTIANGKVYIGTRGNDNGNGSSTILGELDVYGLKPN